MSIPQETISAVRDRADIVEVISRFVELRRSGANHKGLCPFHQEKTPSFVVSAEKQIFHCFGCGKGGNVFSFLMEMEGVSFPEAVRTLGRQVGVEVAAEKSDDAARSRNEAFYRVNEFAAAWYAQNLTGAKSGERARRYLLGRGIPEGAWARFRLGFAGSGWDGLYRAARRERVPLEILEELKLVVPRQKSAGYYDYFRNRVMFPIASPSGRVVAFGARALDAAEPKYLNSVESPVYAKRRVLFGLDLAREGVRERGALVLVEGYTDCIALHVAGLTHAVASCGTAITPDHANLVRRLTRRIILMPDGDAAGTDSALASGSLFLAAGLDVDVALLPAGMDPDTAVRSLERQKFEEITGRPMEYFEYLGYNIKDKPLSPRRKEELARRVTSGLASVDDPLRFDVLLKEFSRVLEVDADGLRRFARGDRAKREEAAGSGRETVGEGAIRLRLEKTLLRLLLDDTPEAREAREKLDVDDFSQDTTREFYKLLDEAWDSHIDLRSNTFSRKAEEAGLEGFAAEIALITFPPGDSGTLLRDTAKRIKEYKIREELRALRSRLLELPGESEEAVAVAELYARLKRALGEL